MKKNIQTFFTGFILFLFSLSAFGEGIPVGGGWVFTPDAPTKSQTCTWIDNLGPDPRTGITKKAQVTTQITRRLPEGTALYETCAQATARKQREVNKGTAYQNANETITGGSRHACNWISPNLPNAPAQTYTLEQRKIRDDENGNPQYESCATAQRRRQQEWLDHEFAGT